METTSKVDNEILNTLQWTEDSYSLKDFVDVFSLPQVVKVIRGYDGGEHSASIRYGQVLTLHAIRDSSIFQAEDTEIKSLLKPSPCDTVIATTVSSDQHLKFCFEIPKDLDIKFVVADGFDNGAKHYTDIVNGLNDRFDVVKFMNTYKTLLIRRQDQIHKFDYDVIKEYIIDKSIFLSKPEDKEGLDMVDGPTFPPQRVENLFQATKENYDTTDLYEKSPAFIMRSSNFENKIPSSDSVYQTSSSLLSILADADYPYKLICNVPLDLSDISVNEVADILRNLNMGQYANIFEDELIDGRLLNELTDSDLESFNMTALHRTKLMKFVNGWRPVFFNQNDLFNEQDETFNPVIPSSDKKTFSVESVESSNEEEIYEDEILKEKDTTMDKFVSSENDPSFYSSFPSNLATRNDENIEENSDIDEAISTPNSGNEEVFDEVDGFQRKLKDISGRKKKSFYLQPSTDMNIFKKSVLAGSSVDGIYHENTLMEKPKRSKIGNHKLAATKEKSKDSIYENVSNILPSTTVHPISSSFFAFQHNSGTDPFMDISKSDCEGTSRGLSQL
ncbi:uncharacterized protein LOC124451278 [Xenia sp. Carnegie-2017]|uniref:uncharacterized protein LOC124451278 n=1 Tax=Xenia sp. Carnegie-2017 TaxID=2897299 RepID=UPI001F036F11|nr:uncharacterized protein LOC124451278 [Xenia sp. Carnegie-2017]XP_046857858.1 uncharacterized protein LOC124451278 [Xenia sp. Carnegie-2017]